MNRIPKWSRRKFIRTVTLGAGGLLVGGCTSGLLTGSPTPVEKENFVLGSETAQRSEEQVLEVNLTAVQTEESIFDGPKTKVWRYQAQVLRADAGSLQEITSSYLGPIFRVKKGQRVRVNLWNEVTEPTIVHWHGLHLSQEMDGHPMYAIRPGERYLYDFQVVDRAGTYWFHPHPDLLTGPQIYRGLAGVFIVSDEEEVEAGLPAGEYDLPLVLQDRRIDNNNQFVYRSGGDMERMTGVLGDTILINGRPNFILSAAATAYRLRLINASNARIYKLAWEDGTPLTVIGTDGGLVEIPIERPYVMLAPGERIDLWVDFYGRAVGSELRMVSLDFSAGMSGMMGMMGGQNQLGNGEPFQVFTVQINREGSGQRLVLPQKLTTIERYREEDATNRLQPRTFSLGMGGMGGMGMMGMGMSFTINGRTFEMKEVARDEIVKLNSLEQWIYDNAGGEGGRGMMGRGMMGGMMQMPHPMHIHGLQFQVLGWEVDPAFESMWTSVHEGLITEGWKDTVLLMPGTRVKLLLKFQDFVGLFLHHCHNLEHEDFGMMRNFRIDR